MKEKLLKGLKRIWKAITIINLGFWVGYPITFIMHGGHWLLDTAYLILLGICIYATCKGKITFTIKY